MTAVTLILNMQKGPSSCKECGTLLTRSPLGSTEILSTWQPSIEMASAILYPWMCWDDMWIKLWVPSLILIPFDNVNGHVTFDLDLSKLTLKIKVWSFTKNIVSLFSRKLWLMSTIFNRILIYDIYKWILLNVRLRSNDLTLISLISLTW